MCAHLDARCFTQPFPSFRRLCARLHEEPSPHVVLFQARLLLQRRSRHTRPRRVRLARPPPEVRPTRRTLEMRPERAAATRTLAPPARRRRRRRRAASADT